MILVPAAWAESPPPHDLEAVVVTATPLATDRYSTAQPTSILAAEELLLKLAPTLGETLAGEPGVRSTYYGPAASRPLIRGLGGDRVQVLSDGLAVLDASGLSEDHAVAIDPALADQVEVIRGPAALLFGPGASGGLVNVVTRRLHDHLPEASSGTLDLRGDTATAERGLAARLDTPMQSLALHLDGAWRKTGDFDSPLGTIHNSASETKTGGLGANWIGEQQVLGVALSRHDLSYGVPMEDGLFIKMTQDRADVASRFSLQDRRFETLNLRAAFNDYAHAEIEADGHVGTRYAVTGRELRATTRGTWSDALEVALGAQWQDSRLKAEGDEAFVPDSDSQVLGVFAFGRQQVAAGTLELGLRLDRQDIRTDAQPHYRETSINGSFGLVWPLQEAWTLLAQLSRSERHPSATELYADGPHAATGQFERGSPEFGIERGLTADIGFRYASARVTAELRSFISRYTDFLFLAPTGQVEDGLPVFQYLQQDARFHGLELTSAWTLEETGRWQLEFDADWVRGRVRQLGDLPRIPPWRVGTALRWRQDDTLARLVIEHNFSQDDVASGESPTRDYTLLALEFSHRPHWLGSHTQVYLRATNLLDELAQVHSSPLKDTVPLPGRSLAAGLRIQFGS